MKRSRVYRYPLVLGYALGLSTPIMDLVGQPSAPMRTLVEEARIDGVAEDLTEVGFLLVDRAGTMVVSQPRDARVLFYNDQGKRIASFGRSGQGPGEFAVTRGGGMARIAGGLVGDTVWLYDAALQRFHFVASSGTLFRGASLPPSIGTVNAPSNTQSALSPVINFFSPLALAGNGEIIGRGVITDRSVARGSRETALEPPVSLLRIIESGQSHRTLALIPPNKCTVSVGDTIGVSGSIPFCTEPELIVSHDGNRIAFLTQDILTETSGAARLLVLDGLGDTLLVRDYPFAARPISARTADSAVIARLRPYYGAGQAPLSPPRNLVMELERKMRESIPKAATAISGIKLGTDNSIWLFVRPAVGAPYHLSLDERGNPTARVQLPSTDMLLAATRSIIWALSTDADGIQSIVRYRIQG